MQPDRVSPPPLSPPPSLRGELIRGSLWMVGARWVARLLGVVSTAVLARLLLPEDFGLMAMAWVVIGLLELCSSFGLDYALIRNPQAARAHFDTAWTLRLLQSAGVAVLAALAAPWAAHYFNEPRVAPLLMALAAGQLINGFANIGPVLFRKELAFAREFWFGLYVKLLGVVVTIALALIFRNYWALVGGTLASSLATMLLSYRMHSYRPRWSLAAWRELWGFSQWMLLVNVGNYAQERADQMLVGRLASAHQMGLYNVASEVASLPTSEVLFPLSRVLFPGFAKLAHDPARLRAAYFSVLGVMTAAALPAGVGLALVAPDLVAVLLGRAWGEAVPLLQGLALFGMFRVVCGQAGNVLLVVGKPQVVAALAWGQLVLLLPALWWAGTRYGVVGVVWAKLLLGGLMGLGQVVCLRVLMGVSLRTTLAVIWRPAVAVAVMAGLTGAMLAAPWVSDVPLLRLAVGVLAGAVTYTLTLTALWACVGRPQGAERVLLDLCRARLG